jgi:LDH2 family malate/lactate/ureidoglycolate dehydrogenase
MIVSVEDLDAEVRRNLLAVGATDHNAAVVADHLVLSELRGVYSHGVQQLPTYTRSVRTGELVPDVSPQVVADHGATALISGNWTFGQVAAALAMDIAIEKASDHGIAIAGIVEAHHTGRLGTYVETAAAAGMGSLVWAGGYGVGRPLAAPWGGSRAVLSTNPIAIGLPGADFPIVIDFATTEIAGGKVMAARRAGEALPEGTMLDRDGHPTTDPNAFFNGGAMLPFGQHKGYALMLAVELLGRTLAGADRYADTERGGAAMRHQGVTLMVFRTDVFQPADSYDTGVANVLKAVLGVPPAAGFDEVLVPGQRAARTEQDRRRNGIPLSDSLWQAMTSDKFLTARDA